MLSILFLLCFVRKDVVHGRKSECGVYWNDSNLSVVFHGEEEGKRAQSRLHQDYMKKPSAKALSQFATTRLMYWESREARDAGNNEIKTLS